MGSIKPKRTGSKTRNKWISKIAKKEGGKSQARIGDIREMERIQEFVMAEQIVRQVVKYGGKVDADRSYYMRSLKNRVRRIARKMLSEME